MRISKVFFLSLLPIIFFVHMAHGQDADGYPRAMQGPMVGNIQSGSFTVWIRTSWTFPVQVAYSLDETFANEELTQPVTPEKASDYCVKVKVDNLRPDTRYYYRLVIDGKGDKYLAGKPPYSVVTAPAQGQLSNFRLAFGSCARWQQAPEQRIWPVIRSYNPQLFFWLGDNVYADTLDPDILAEELARQREVPTIQKLLATVPQFRNMGRS